MSSESAPESDLLASFLKKAFTPDEFIVFLHKRSETKALAHDFSTRLTANQFFLEASLLLSRHGRVDRHLFHALADERPGRKIEIEDLKRAICPGPEDLLPRALMDRHGADVELDVNVSVPIENFTIENLAGLITSVRVLAHNQNIITLRIRAGSTIVTLWCAFKDLGLLLGEQAMPALAAHHVRSVQLRHFSVPVSDSDHFGELYGDSPSIREAFAKLERIAELGERFPVLIIGETGTGKELAARGLHDASGRAAGPFVVLDCTALPRELAESHLLGHIRGAFTGAVRDHAGLFEQADGGTLFIDELGELPPELQARLLRPIERGEVVRLGDATARRVDVRVIAATHRDLRLMMSQGRFREDLYFRLASKVVELPALRDRGADIVLLARRFLRVVCERGGLSLRKLSPASCAALLRGTWPENVRQLKTTLECAAMTSSSSVLEPEDLHLDEPGRDLLRRVGFDRGWIVRGAKLAGLDRTGFIKASKRLKLVPE